MRRVFQKVSAKMELKDRLIIVQKNFEIHAPKGFSKRSWKMHNEKNPCTDLKNVLHQINSAFNSGFPWTFGSSLCIWRNVSYDLLFLQECPG